MTCRFFNGVDHRLDALSDDDRLDLVHELCDRSLGQLL
jgi:hypothetical protein